MRQRERRLTSHRLDAICACIPFVGTIFIGAGIAVIGPVGGGGRAFTNVRELRDGCTAEVMERTAQQQASKTVLHSNQCQEKTRVVSLIVLDSRSDSYDARLPPDACFH